MKGENITELEDEKWPMKLAFLCDITAKHNDLNLNLQGKKKCLTDMMSVIKTFKETIKRYAAQLRKHELRNFKSMEEECIHNPNRDFEDFAEHLDVDGRSPVPKVTTAVFTFALFTGNGILWKECVVLPHLCKRTFKGEYVLTPARFIRPINNWGASEDFPALKNVIDRCAVTLR
ncbi:hypothetical protein TNCV_3903291 [Trichonephila clavipes]|nr:hypothetical protein TNCV_3903291 [Trichonephila clavipes]